MAMTPIAPLLCLLTALCGGEGRSAAPTAGDDLEQCVRTFRRAAARRSDEASQGAAQKALDALVATGDPDACEALALEFAQCAQRLSEVQVQRRRTRARLAQGQRVVEGLRLRAERDESLAQVLKDQVRATEQLKRRLGDLGDQDELPRPWKRAVLDGAGRLLTDLSDSRHRRAPTAVSEHERLASTRATMANRRVPGRCPYPYRRGRWYSGETRETGLGFFIVSNCNRTERRGAGVLHLPGICEANESQFGPTLRYKLLVFLSDSVHTILSFGARSSCA